MSKLKEKVIRKAGKLGASLVGFAPVSRWTQYDEVKPDYRPESIWRQAKTVIVLGVPVLLPIIESTPSINYQEQYNTTNILLDQMAFRLAVYLNDRGHASIFLPRDGYGSLEALLENPFGCFSHVFAARYAGLGTLSYSHNFINEKYGPRARYVSVFTSAEIEGDPVIEGSLCRGCRVCERLCPARALSPDPDSSFALLDKSACTLHHQSLLEESRWPCGTCVKVCPIGEDRKLYGSLNIDRYLKERDAIESGSGDPEYRALVHLRSHGSKGSGRRHQAVIPSTAAD